MKNQTMHNVWVRGVAIVLSLFASQPLLATPVATEVATVIQQKFSEVPVEILPAGKPDAVILRGGPVSNEVANQISLSAAKVPGVNELINEIEVE
ncbi:MAG: hypothetical protein HKN70_02690 [Gammaproteobacteria bacterium]|nr:hypothetical protein [Gammaproteobacteria bacterium]